MARVAFGQEQAFEVSAEQECRSIGVSARSAIGEGPSLDLFDNWYATLEAGSPKNLIPWYATNVACLNVLYPLQAIMAFAPGSVTDFGAVLRNVEYLIATHHALGHANFARNFGVSESGVDGVAWSQFGSQTSFLGATGLTALQFPVANKTLDAYCDRVNVEYLMLVAHVQSTQPELLVNVPLAWNPLNFKAFCLGPNYVPALLDWEHHLADYKSAFLKGDAFAEAVAAYTFLHWETGFAGFNVIPGDIQFSLATGLVDDFANTISLTLASYQYLKAASDLSS